MSCDTPNSIPTSYSPQPIKNLMANQATTLHELEVLDQDFVYVGIYVLAGTVFAEPCVSL